MTYHYITTEQQLRDAAENQILPYYKTNPVFALDLETFNHPGFTSYKPYSLRNNKLSFDIEPPETEASTALFQIGADPNIFNSQWIVDAIKIQAHVIKEVLGEVISKSLIIGQNLKYDISFLTTQFDIWPDKCRDTYIIHKVRTAGDGSESSLGALYSKYLDYGWFITETGMNFDQYIAHKKELQHSDWSKELSEQQLKYAADDVSLIFYLYKAQKEDLEKFVKYHNKSKIYDLIRLECDILTEVALMEVRGLKFDSDYVRSDIIPYLEKKADEATLEAQKLLPHKIKTKGRGKAKEEFIEYTNLRSPKLKEVFNTPNCQADTLKEHVLNHPAIPAVLKYKKAAHLLSSFTENYIQLVHPDGRHHPDYFQIGTDTGRFSSNKPNIMQIPARETLFGEISASKLFRTAYRAEEGYVLIDADFSTIEPRLIAEVFNVKKLREAFNNGVDYHGFTAQILLDTPEPPKKGSFERDQLGKTANLAMGYKAGAKKVAQLMLKYTIDSDKPIYWDEFEAQEKMDRYFEALPEVLEAQKDIEYIIRKDLDPFNSLQEFKQRRPLYTQFTKIMPRPRGFFLLEHQEIAAKNVLPRDQDQRLHPLHKWHQVIKDDGSRSYYNEWKKTIGNLSREAYNHIIQGEQANILKMAIKLLGKKLREHKEFDPIKEGLITCIHDELLVEVKLENKELGMRLVEEAMLEAGRMFLKKVPCLVEVKSGSTWAEAK
jgi:DNA polymerase I